MHMCVCADIFVCVCVQQDLTSLPLACMFIPPIVKIHSLPFQILAGERSVMSHSHGWQERLKNKYTAWVLCDSGD